MNLSQCGLLTTTAETGVWYRAIEPQHWNTSLQTSQTMASPNRFNGGPFANPPFETLYLAEDLQVALFEAEALLGPPTQPSGVLAQPRLAQKLQRGSSVGFSHPTLGVHSISGPIDSP